MATEIGAICSDPRWVGWRWAFRGAVRQGQRSARLDYRVDRKRRVRAQPRADIVIDHKTKRFEDEAADLNMVFDLIDGETRERSWRLLKKGGVLVSTLTDPSQEKANQVGVRALRYTVEADGAELEKIASLIIEGKVKPYVQKTFPLAAAAEALALVEHGHSTGKVVLRVE
jgi:NADPH:quinone reductase-like Zn-dependent oxidoreductase